MLRVFYFRPPRAVRPTVRQAKTSVALPIEDDVESASIVALGGLHQCARRETLRQIDVHQAPGLSGIVRTTGPSAVITNVFS
jgi:hypothetical protein